MLVPIALVFLAGCSQVAETPVASPHASIRNTGYYSPILNMEIDFGESPRSGALVRAAADEVLAIGNGMTQGKPPVAGDIKAIQFTVLGKPGGDAGVGRKIIHFTVDGQELRQLAHAGVDSATLLESARDFGSWTPANDDVMNDYCESRPKTGVCTNS